MQVNCHLEDRLVQDLDDLALAAGMTRQQFIADIIKMWLDLPDGFEIKK